uniref:Uncharacterized protein n=1 Tax=Pleurocladia lacustris TaxID=246121 RepID=A0A1I9LVD6_9PHAE|nr:hypothetical protein [Pleurocladia lacustris]YP_009327096.1 hypothetical protein [Pleurocladia lacustris]ANS57555.1 hypothetical protein [Pleurocladia lacustris]ANS57556.1 hypothetical protein [Pleurocladia lacustris]ANS57699.1 hypothetical protein [Pleurocladia lacustris]ANS57700.1 hypothetical protein [Pleurocladia lacustris]
MPEKNIKVKDREKEGVDHDVNKKDPEPPEPLTHTLFDAEVLGQFGKLWLNLKINLTKPIFSLNLKKRWLSVKRNLTKPIAALRLEKRWLHFLKNATIKISYMSGFGRNLQIRGHALKNFLVRFVNGLDDDIQDFIKESLDPIGLKIDQGFTKRLSALVDIFWDLETKIQTFLEDRDLRILFGTQSLDPNEEEAYLKNLEVVNTSIEVEEVEVLPQEDISTKKRSKLRSFFVARLGSIKLLFTSNKKRQKEAESKDKDL